ncbi:unnamed protein product [Arabidopsis thaliana]|uniref:(thale cress) hypothetical protein n=1 Tax=Arabidopsis thaliana TaxID=3702 RepID=A0A7G2FBK7_ARATH|nr:unnamed protein product [Arabidopsis thaliana]
MVLCFQDPDNIYSPKKTKKDDGERVITKQKSFLGLSILDISRKSVDIARSSRKETLVEWARPMLNDARKLGRIMDPRLEDQYSETGARKAATLAYQCLRYRPKTRPDISTVVSVLQDIKDYKDDIPIGIFTYTVPTKPRREVKETSLQNFDKPRRETKETSLQNFDKTRREVKETSLQNFDKPRNVSTTDNHQKFRAPAHTARNHRITLRNGYNSPMRNEAGGERY